jgi:excisionase family DNA binding protein
MRLLTIEDVSDLLRVPRARVYGLIRSGLLPGVRVGRTVRVAEAALEGWISRGGCPLPPDAGCAALMEERP